jgi:putative FmdB family regulatory protein
MPIYEYRCQSCGHELEKLQRLSDVALVDCPECGKSTLKRLISAAGFRLKGAGWYETDFKKSNQRNLVDSGSDGGTANTTTESGKEAGKEPAKEIAKESAKDSKSSDSGSSKAADKPSKPPSASVASS